MNIQADISELLAELDACRASRGLSRKAVADACGVSEATISRAFNQTVEPSYKLLQDIAAAVQYKPDNSVIVPEDATQESYIAYFKELLIRKDMEHDRHVRQLQAHYNMLHRQDRRTIVVLGAILGVLVLFICGLFVYDFAHLDRGWIQEAVVDCIGSIWS